MNCLSWQSLKEKQIINNENGFKSDKRNFIPDWINIIINLRMEFEIWIKRERERRKWLQFPNSFLFIFCIHWIISHSKIQTNSENRKHFQYSTWYDIFVAWDLYYHRIQFTHACRISCPFHFLSINCCFLPNSWTVVLILLLNIHHSPVLPRFVFHFHFLFPVGLVPRFRYVLISMMADG